MKTLNHASSYGLLLPWLSCPLWYSTPPEVPHGGPRSVSGTLYLFLASARGFEARDLQLRSDFTHTAKPFPRKNFIRIASYLTACENADDKLAKMG